MSEQYWKLKRAYETGRVIGEVSRNKGCMRMLLIVFLSYVALMALYLIFQKVGEVYKP